MQKNDSAIMALVVSENASIKIPIIEANPAVLLNIVDKFSFKNLICDCVCNINKAMYILQLQSTMFLKIHSSDVPKIAVWQLC